MTESHRKSSRRFVPPRGMPMGPPKPPPYSWLEPIEMHDPPLNANGDIMWRCRCRGPAEGSCGNITIQPYENVRSGGVISCGCAVSRALAQRSVRTAAGEVVKGPGRFQDVRLAWLRDHGPASVVECAEVWGVGTHAANAWLSYQRRERDAVEVVSPGERPVRWRLTAKGAEGLPPTAEAPSEKLLTPGENERINNLDVADPSSA